MKIIVLRSLVVFPILMFSSCLQLFEPEHFGIKESTWNTLSEKNKQKAIDGYHDRERRKQAYEAEIARKQQVDSFWRKVTLDNNVTYKVSDSSKMKNWKAGQEIVLQNNDCNFYDYTLTNVQTGQIVKADID